jgi:hypothetical protein
MPIAIAIDDVGARGPVKAAAKVVFQLNPAPRSPVRVAQ